MNEQKTIQAENKGPMQTFQYGAVKVKIWDNQYEFEGRTLKKPNVQIEKVYKAKSGEWGSTSTFDLNDLPKLRVAVLEAYKFLLEKKDEEN